MDWKQAIETKHEALTRIIAGLIAMIGIGTLGRIPKPLYRAVSRILFPAESAVRRLIVMAARGLMVTLPPPRQMPKGLAITAKGGGRVSFQLFDSRKRFNRRKYAKVAPRIHFFNPSPLVPLFLRQPVEPPKPEPDDTIDAARLGRRLAAVKAALDNLPHQARRMARWKARRAMSQKMIFKSPLRLGPPPGNRKMATEEIDFVLRECHWMARDALKEDSS